MGGLDQCGGFVPRRRWAVERYSDGLREGRQVKRNALGSSQPTDSNAHRRRFHNDTFNSIYHRVSSYVSFGGHGLRRDLPVHKALQGLLGGPSGATSTGRRRVWGSSHAHTPSSHSYTDSGSIAATGRCHPYETSCASGGSNFHTCSSGEPYHCRRRDKPEREGTPHDRSQQRQLLSG